MVCTQLASTASAPIVRPAGPQGHSFIQHPCIAFCCQTSASSSLLLILTWYIWDLCKKTRTDFCTFGITQPNLLHKPLQNTTERCAHRGWETEREGERNWTTVTTTGRPFAVLRREKDIGTGPLLRLFVVTLMERPCRWIANWRKLRRREKKNAYKVRLTRWCKV